MGYANRFIMLQFPEISEEGDMIWVRIRNPRIMPPGELVKRDVRKAASGDDLDAEDALEATYEVFGKLVFDWHVYDGMDVSDDPQLLGPPTKELMAKLPSDILARIGDELAKVNPRNRTESQEVPTSS